MRGYPTDRIGLHPYDKDRVVLTVHYYANPADYEAQKSIAVNYLMTRHGARILADGLTRMLRDIDTPGRVN